MIYSSIHNSGEEKKYHKVINEILDFIKRTDFSKMESKTYTFINNKEISYSIQDVLTSNEGKRAEVHKKYVDIQYLIEGKEKIGAVLEKGNLEVDEDLFEESDVLFYKKAEKEIFFELESGDFCVFFPSDIHKPCCEFDGPANIRKIVFKIPVELFD